MSGLTVVDLFSGCGGMSLGFQRAGYKILGGVESDPHAAETYAKNLHKLGTSEEVARHSEPKDILNFDPEKFCDEYLESQAREGLVNVIIGGPPCQAFARIGRAKLRKIMDHEHAYLNDKRADLYTHFLAYVEKLRPTVVVMENVPEILNYGGKNVAQEIAISLNDMEYEPRSIVLNAAHYGVPQTRVRFFMIAFRKDINTAFEFPSPSHYFPTQHTMFKYARKLAPIIPAEKQLFTEMESGNRNFAITVKEPSADLPMSVTCEMALGDLCAIYTSKMQPNRGKRDLTTLKKYRQGRPTSYAEMMRRWDGFESKGGVCDHVIRFLPRDHEIFRRMEPNDQYPAALQIAREIIKERLDQFEEEHGYRPDAGTLEYEKLKKETVPPYDDSKFPNKWQKLDADRPSHTITAHLGKDTYSHIHYDSDQARVISVREAARLQSFPDGFRFPPAMSHAYRQIGNAVPPLLAFRLAEAIKEQLG